MKLSLSLKWYDLWIGFYWDKKNKDLYFCPIPCVVIKISFPNDGAKMYIAYDSNHRLRIIEDTGQKPNDLIIIDSKAYRIESIKDNYLILK